MADWECKGGKNWVTKWVGKNQALTINAMPSGADLTGATLAMMYRKPNGTEGTFTNAPSIDSPETAGLFSWSADANELDQASGKKIPWRIWVSVTISGVTTPGRPFLLPVYEQGNDGDE